METIREESEYLRKHFMSIYKVPYHRAEDLAQNTMVKILRYEESYEDRGYRKTYIKVIARSVFVNDYLKRVRHAQGMVKARQEFTSTQDHSYQVHIDARLEPEIQEIMDDMPDVFREVLERVANGMVYREVAEDMDIPIGTVMSRLSRARKFFKCKYKEEVCQQ